MLSDTDIWGVVFDSGHWNHGGWTHDGRNPKVICRCGRVLVLVAEIRS